VSPKAWWNCRGDFNNLPDDSSSSYLHPWWLMTHHSPDYTPLR
jgi:hypothetical protein